MRIRIGIRNLFDPWSGIRNEKNSDPESATLNLIQLIFAWVS
jgi:hypothetical protein